MLVLMLPFDTCGQSGKVYFNDERHPVDSADASWYEVPPVPIEGTTTFQYACYYLNGKKKEIGTYSSLDSGGIKDGFVTVFDTSGLVSEQGEYTSNKTSGHWKYYHPGKKQLWYEEVHKVPGRVDYDLTSYYESGAIKRKESFKFNKTTFEKNDTGSCYDETGKEIPFTPFFKMPDFPGGDKGRMEFLRNNLHYPLDALENNRQGRVTVGFMVKEDGSLNNVEIIRSVWPSLDKEATRVVAAMPAWQRGMQDDKPVSVYFTLPIMFTLE
jgi:protein TonB